VPRQGAKQGTEATERWLPGFHRASCPLVSLFWTRPKADGARTCAHLTVWFGGTAQATQDFCCPSVAKRTTREEPRQTRQWQFVQYGHGHMCSCLPTQTIQQVETGQPASAVLESLPNACTITVLGHTHITAWQLRTFSLVSRCFQHLSSGSALRKHVFIHCAGPGSPTASSTRPKWKE